MKFCSLSFLTKKLKELDLDFIIAEVTIDLSLPAYYSSRPINMLFGPIYIRLELIITMNSTWHLYMLKFNLPHLVH